MTNTRSLDLERSSAQYAGIADGSQTGLDITGDIAIECWMKRESDGATTNIVTKADNTGDIAYILRFNADNTVSLIVSDTGSSGSIDNFISTSTITADSTWHHLGVSLDVSTSTCTFYFDKSGETPAAGSLTSIYNGIAPFNIGQRDEGTDYYDGLIDEVAIYNAIKDFSSLDNEADKAGRSNLQGFWKLNNNYLDETANNNDLTATGSPVFSTDVPFAGDAGGFFAIL